MDEDRPISGAASSFKESELPPSTSAYSIPDNIDAQEVPTAEDDIDNRPLEVRIADKVTCTPRLPLSSIDLFVFNEL